MRSSIRMKGDRFRPPPGPGPRAFDKVATRDGPVLSNSDLRPGWVSLMASLRGDVLRFGPVSAGLPRLLHIRRQLLAPLKKTIKKPQYSRMVTSPNVSTCQVQESFVPQAKVDSSVRYPLFQSKTPQSSPKKSLLASSFCLRHLALIKCKLSAITYDG